MRPFLALMGFCTVRRSDGNFDEKEGEHGEDGGLDEAHEDFKSHERHRKDVGYKIDDNRDQDFPGENIAKETE